MEVIPTEEEHPPTAVEEEHEDVTMVPTTTVPVNPGPQQRNIMANISEWSKQGVVQQQPETSVEGSPVECVAHLHFFQGFYDDYDESDLNS
mmetsp:Transcript_20180/g.24104  ORF Transcript_20180/g.24104 Transcript_20180/m.24104 type:complete len:91 (-) Transcript_20180:202-474(-)|eukprot:CAMPEP_0198248644 /NCGR_PEP_ID=MMETSP1447-20131203/383_1 /TAXON_ID=420782 /ORGANISM="Chaetoceros dichaeta, Strain CCMP1751" /LENGTH=90 /DNA_ID=CAMNT_0043933107 /DNA_START=256 /DNA_END=528 /DNA_ORIENTATION=+